jgi:GNAT superfamily N-acetyltransferase
VKRRLLDVTLDNLGQIPPEPLNTVFWELDEDPEVGARFEKEEWFSSTLLEWGSCGKLLTESGTAVGFAQYAPARLFPRLGRFRCGRASADAVYLSYCYVVPSRRGGGVGTELVRAVGRDILDRGIRAVEALGDREGEPGWILPVEFLARNGFAVLRDDRRYPLMRLDLETAVVSDEAREAVLAPVPLPAPGAA